MTKCPSRIEISLHLASDALVSLGLVVGIAIYYTDLYWIDPLLSIIICIVIIVSTWSLLKDSLRLSLDGVPDNVDTEKIKQEILQTKGLKGLHHIHIWAISTTQNAMTAHLLVSDELINAEVMILKANLKHALEHQNVHHTTLEIDYDHCGEEEDC